MKNKHHLTLVKKSKRANQMRFVSILLVGALLLGMPGLPSVSMDAFATDKTAEELSEELKELEESLSKDKAQLDQLEKSEASEKEKKKNLEDQVETLNAKVDVILASIAQTQGNIAVKETEINTKTDEIAQKQADYDGELIRFGDRLSAMQELNDGGTVALLSAVDNLYQLLTFPQTMQDIADKNAEMLRAIESQRFALVQAKEELKLAKDALQAEYEALEAQRVTLKADQDELNGLIDMVSESIEVAEAAKDKLQDKIDADTIKFNEVANEIQGLIENGMADYDDLVFDSTFIVPLPSGQYRISQYFSSSHPAIDYAAAQGTPIYASASGYVTAAEFNNGGYGNYVLIYHGTRGTNTFSSLYAHMMQLPSVSAGQYVEQGQLIGYVGNTGYSFGNHLHYELWANASVNNSVGNKAQRVNPLDY